jgi:hypothetical protein
MEEEVQPDQTGSAEGVISSMIGAGPPGPPSGLLAGPPVKAVSP